MSLYDIKHFHVSLKEGNVLFSVFIYIYIFSFSVQQSALCLKQIKDAFGLTHKGQVKYIFTLVLGSLN